MEGVGRVKVLGLVTAPCWRSMPAASHALIVALAAGQYLRASTYASPYQSRVLTRMEFAFP